MKTLKSFIAILLCIPLCVSLTQAQAASGKQQEAQATNTIAQDVLIIIQQEKVRFTAQKTVAEMQLQIFDQGGELVYDSGAVTEPELTWALQQANGETVKSGLYAYRLSIKEAGAETPRVRRGHFIVDRARERDGQTDRLWITSQNDGGVGTELTVARNEGVTIAGASTVSDRASGKDGEKAQREGEGDDETKSKKKDGQETVAVDAIGTPGQIVKFISGEEIGDSGITETGEGNVGIGTTVPISKLHILSGSGVPAPRLESSGEIGFGSGWDFYHGTIGKGYVGVPDSAAVIAPGEMLLFGGAGTKTSLWAGETRAMTIETDGRVGIGTTRQSLAKLLVVSNDTTLVGVEGFSADLSGRGVVGTATGLGGVGVKGTATASNGVGVFGVAEGGVTSLAGLFDGNVKVSRSVDVRDNLHVNGRLTKSSGSFKIDHPLDPANKYLSHSFVESPDMMNIYNGNVVLDRRGRATVTLPAYFEALNREFRYQLTALGAPANLYVAAEIKGNTFKIAGGRPGMKVSWQVTGVRQDAYANAHRIKVEEEKTGEERGTYLHPEAFGQPQEKGVTHARHSAATQQVEEEASKGIAAAKRTATGQR